MKITLRVDTKENLCFDEIKPLIEKQVRNIESTPQIEEDYNNLRNKNSNINLIIKEIANSNSKSNNDEILWTYDTGCSEHITSINIF